MPQNLATPMPNLNFLPQFVSFVEGKEFRKWGPDPMLGVTLGGWKRYHWISGARFPVVFSSNDRPTTHRLATIHERDQPTNDVTTRSVAICASHYIDRYSPKRQQQQIKSKSKTNADHKLAASLPRHGRGSIFCDPTQPNPVAKGPNPTQPMDGSNPRPCLSLP